jgi:hypothetical protein
MDSSTHADPIHEPPAEDSIRAGHEVRDVNIRVLLWLGAAVAGGIIVVLIVLQLLIGSLESSASNSDPELSPLASEPASAAPRLQATPVHDYLEYRRQQEETLNSYGWVDRHKQVVRVPVSRAMELILEPGLPEPKSEDDSKEAQPDRETSQ